MAISFTKWYIDGVDDDANVGVAPKPSLMPVSDVLWLFVLRMFIYAAYRLDFSDSNARFSRLV